MAVTVLAFGLSSAMPGSAATTEIRQHDNLFGQATSQPVPNGAYNYVSFYLQRQRTLSPSASPGTLFPIVIDPNSPPTPPASAFTETLSGNVFVGGCLPNTGCWGEQVPLSKVTLTVEEAPFLANAVTIAFTTTVQGNVPFTATLRFDRPAYTTFGNVGTPPSVNPWTSGSNAHVEAGASRQVMVRYGYATVGSITGPQVGTASPTTGGYFQIDRWMTAMASADV